jgi:choline dehydrogenase-like flavoprotein
MKAPAPRAFDVVVVGAGVAGALIAWRLGKAGLTVALLEAGAAKVDRQAALAAWGASAGKSLGSPYGGAAIGPEHPGPLNNYYDQAGPEDYLSTYERIAGGTTWHWLGHTPRLLPNDFSLKSTYGVGVDWPISYATLEPWYCAAEEALGVAGDDEQWGNIHGAFRSRRFPMPPIWPSWSDRSVARAVDGLTIDGREVSVLATPAARNSRPYDGRPPCAGNSSCIPICPIGAKYDGYVHVQKALKTGKVKLIDRAVATRLTVGDPGRIDAVEYRLDDGSRRTVRGRIVVLTASAIESSKLLLMSADADKGVANGVANSSDQVGRGLMDHMQKSVFVLAKEPLYPFRGPPSTSGIESFRDGPFRAQHSAIRFSLNNDGWARRGAASPAADVKAAVDQGLFGRELRKLLFESVSRQFRFSLSTEVLPDPNNRVTLSNLKDGDGLPRPRISFDIGGYTRAAFGPGLAIVAQLVQAMNGTIVEQDTSVEPHHYSPAGHVMGGCRMGVSAAEAVTDANCRSFDQTNLYIVGASVLPTCGTANPTLTVAALSLRAAEHIATAEFGRPPGCVSS